jgi:hypothetical protein
MFKKLQFPIALRKMWSGGEVQQWLDEQVDNQWLDIASAPKGATQDNPCKELWIVGINAYDQQRVIRWCLDYPSEGCWMFATSPSNYIDGIQEFHPTHWMPLAQSPKR